MSSEVMAAADMIRVLDLTPLVPEGGYLRQTHIDESSCAIYYLLEAPDYSGLHRLDFPEIWAHHCGAPLRMLLIDDLGVVHEPILGSDVAAGQHPQVVVPKGWWQAAEPDGEWSLTSTFMAPPYSDDCVTFARADDLVGQHPDHEERIRRLCRF